MYIYKRIDNTGDERINYMEDLLLINQYYEENRPYETTPDNRLL